MVTYKGSENVFNCGSFNLSIKDIKRVTLRKRRRAQKLLHVFSRVVLSLLRMCPNITLVSSDGGCFWTNSIQPTDHEEEAIRFTQQVMGPVGAGASSGVRRKLPRGTKFRHNRVTSQINFRGSAEGTTILGESGNMPPGKFCKITPKNTHFCAFWKQVLDNTIYTFF